MIRCEHQQWLETVDVMLGVLTAMRAGIMDVVHPSLTVSLIDGLDCKEERGMHQHRMLAKCWESDLLKLIPSPRSEGQITRRTTLGFCAP